MLDNKPLISICIANFNGMGVIDECLRSVMEQQGDIAIEILVHDDASVDGSVAHIQANYPRVVLIESAENAGFSIANNRMLAMATGQYILLLNNDAALYPDALQTLLAEAMRLGRPAILTLPQYDATSGVLVDRGCLLDPFFNPVPNLDPKRSDVAMVIGACLWIPRELWDELEGFPEWFGSIAEDMYLCCRARLAGYAVCALSSSGYRHWQGNSFGGNRIQDCGLSTTFSRRALSERNKTFTIYVVSPAILLFPILFVHIVLLCIEGLLLTLFKSEVRVWTKIYGPVIPELWRNRTRLWNLRQATQSRRRISVCYWQRLFVPMPYKAAMLYKHGLPKIS